MMFYTSDKLTVFECVIFVSQFHVRCKTGTLGADHLTLGGGGG